MVGSDASKDSENTFAKKGWAITSHTCTQPSHATFKKYGDICGISKCGR